MRIERQIKRWVPYGTAIDFTISHRIDTELQSFRSQKIDKKKKKTKIWKKNENGFLF